MALWNISQETTYLYKTGSEAQTSAFIRQIDDTVEPVLESTVALFGAGEIYTVEGSEGELLAKIQYSRDNKQGWTRDHETEGDYIVQFRAQRQP